MENNILDIKGFSCTMLIVKTKKAMDKLNSGDVLEIHSTDKGSVNDLKGWAAATGNEFVGYKEEDNSLKFWIKKG
ncbi:sulfurtransferase TusA family protein [Alkalihalobacterium elongatum]|uniref:sulfurtransferase TusA family protein n=1 Tax=Alkalihalobacterium elongatum TaxID=2675466 RepID=UPI001C1F4719|nr:sulfurtransferase TusA family protein [Alkalihalobacterium elongatum]